MTNKDRKETTKFLSKLLIRDKFSGIGKYWASEVSIDYGSKGGRRVDFMQFVPPNQCSISALEKGIFICYEIKSCKEDVFSGNGLNFIGEKNYIVTTMQCWKDLIACDGEQKIRELIHDSFPESSDRFGIMVACPDRPMLWTPADEFEHPTPLPEDGNTRDWKLKTIIPCRECLRNRSMSELLFYMLRSGKN